MTSLHPTYRKS